MTLLIDTLTGAGSMLGTVAAIIVAFIAIIITITLLGLLITVIILVLVIVKKREKLNTLHSGEAQFTNQARAHRYNRNNFAC